MTTAGYNGRDMRDFPASLPTSTSSAVTPNYHVAIVGGGLVGKAAALLLAQQGLQIALLAPAATANLGEGVWDRRIYAFSASSQALLARLRIWPALDARRIQVVQEMRVWGDEGGAPAGKLAFSAYGAALPQLAWIVESGHVERTLDAALQFAPGVTIFPLQAQALQITSNAAELTLADGARLTAACVIGADGAHSWVRTQTGIEVVDRSYEQMGLVANFAMERPHHGTAFQWFLGPGASANHASDTPTAGGGPGEVLALLPLPDQQVSMVWSAGHAHAQTLLELGSSELAQAVQAAAGGQVGAVTGALRCLPAIPGRDAEGAQGFPLMLRRATRFIGERVVLVGDAAHVIHPLAGQGMNLGLRDVAELGRVFAAKEAFRDHGDPRLLRRYERARQGDTAVMAFTTDRLHHLFALPGGIPQRIRNFGLQVVDRHPVLKNFLIGRALG